MTDKKSNDSRRKLLKSIAAGSGAVVAGKSLPESWTKPVINSIVLPAHAATTSQSLCEIHIDVSAAAGHDLVFWVCPEGGSSPDADCIADEESYGDGPYSFSQSYAAPPGVYDIYFSGSSDGTLSASIGCCDETPVSGNSIGVGFWFSGKITIYEDGTCSVVEIGNG